MLADAETPCDSLIRTTTTMFETKARASILAKQPCQNSHHNVGQQFCFAATFASHSALQQLTE